MKDLKTSKKVKVSEVDIEVSKILRAGTTLNYAGKRTAISAGATLTLKDIEKAVESIKEADRKHREWVNELVSSKSWQKLNRQLMELSIILLEIIQSDKNTVEVCNDYLTVKKCWIAIQPDTYHPVHLDMKKRCEKLMKKHLTTNNK